MKSVQQVASASKFFFMFEELQDFETVSSRFSNRIVWNSEFIKI